MRSKQYSYRLVMFLVAVQCVYCMFSPLLHDHIPLNKRCKCERELPHSTSSVPWADHPHVSRLHLEVPDTVLPSLRGARWHRSCQLHIIPSVG